ncbi:MAG: hypothetical protein Q7Q73_17105 [Verrucomicrobiota bacterium JB024]|nr:hypothetical protein [Verrucomicrobiota bacterium JB024]
MGNVLVFLVFFVVAASLFTWVVCFQAIARSLKYDFTAEWERAGRVIYFPEASPRDLLTCGFATNRAVGRWMISKPDFVDKSSSLANVYLGFRLSGGCLVACWGLLIIDQCFLRLFSDASIDFLLARE